MHQFIEFIGNHWLLVSAFGIVLVVLIVTEVRRLKAGATSLEPAAATQLYNRQDAVFLDVRGEAEFRKAHLPGAVNAPASALAERLSKLERLKQRPVIVYCATGLQSGRAAAELKKAGFGQIYELKGGFAAWQAAGFPLERK